MVERQRSTEMKSGWEELTVADMVQRGFSKLLAPNYVFCLGVSCYGVWVFKPRTKIESIVRRGGNKDPDAPECVASITYWCRKKSSLDEKEAVSQKATANIQVKPSTDLLSSLFDGPTMRSSGAPSTSSTLAPSETGDALSLASNLLDVKNSQPKTSGALLKLTCQPKLL